MKKVVVLTLCRVAEEDIPYMFSSCLKPVCSKNPLEGELIAWHQNKKTPDKTLIPSQSVNILCFVVLTGGADCVWIPDSVGTDCCAAAGGGQFAAGPQVQRVCRFRSGQDCHKEAHQICDAYYFLQHFNVPRRSSKPLLYNIKERENNKHLLWT